ncbi:HK-domain-containing protein [Schizophyllum commune Tattone D]|nr:HK-domain-containing protein [Schizophyllum commune Tattone D]
MFGVDETVLCRGEWKDGRRSLREDEGERRWRIASLRGAIALHDCEREYPGCLLTNYNHPSGPAANLSRTPLVFDPVGVGATDFRKRTVKELLDAFQISVLKGNAGELAAVAGSNEVRAKGVDSAGPGFADPAGFVRGLARKEKTTTLLTGPIDYLSDGTRAVKISNGHHILGRVTGSGCMLGSLVATYCAAAAHVADADAAESSGTSATVDGELTRAGSAADTVRGDMLVGALAGVLVLSIAAEKAVARGDVYGPGTFLPALMDEVAHLQPEEVRGRAKVEGV